MGFGIWGLGFGVCQVNPQNPSSLRLVRQHQVQFLGARLAAENLEPISGPIVDENILHDPDFLRFRVKAPP